MTPHVRASALDRVYLVSRGGRGRVVVLREEPSGATCEIHRARRRLSGVDWAAVARAILGDLLEEPPTRKLALDYSRFLPRTRDPVFQIHASDVQTWLETWQPPLATTLLKRVR